MKLKENSGGYGNAYQKHEERKQKLKRLAEKAQYQGLLKLATALGIAPEDLLRILAGVQGITPDLGRKIDLRWIAEFGTTEVRVPKPFLPEIKKCTTFTYLSGLEHGETLYMAINHRDVLPDFIEYENYDHAMDSIKAWLDDWVTTFFRRKDKAMALVKASGLSMSTHYQHECMTARRYEFELIDNATEEMRYQIIYSKGKIIRATGNLPLQEIVSLLKKIGKFEV